MLRSSGKFWGIIASVKLLDLIRASLKWLAKEPRLGKHRTDIAEGYYSFPEGQHIVFYIINPERIEIIGIPHKDMDIISYFQTH
ncbi:MAG: type II toxin-antitoxin system RelE/ParE family toxin [Pseudomonadota bacterium]